jgi:aminocarboxymuconate-semialdehyde decarboxylase
MAILEPSPIEFYYRAKPAIGAELFRMINENTAQFTNSYPERLLGLATIPLQDIDLAIEELNYAIENLDLKGVAMVSNINGQGFDEEQFLPFFEEVERRNLPIFIHPTNPLEAQRLHKYYLINFIGFPMETTIFATQLVFGGVLDRYPHLKICLAHSGGVLPFLLGRLEHGHSVRPEAQENSKHPFKYYLRNFYVDSITFHPEILHFVISIMPEGHVFMGTDYPFDMADMAPISTVRSALSDKVLINDILGKNVSRIMGI